MEKVDTVFILRALLSSAKDPYNLSTLNIDFKKETGIDIPLYGYKNLSDFLHSIPDTVKITGVYPVEKVHLVASEKSAHIVSLVQRQKSSEKNKKKKDYFHCDKSPYIRSQEYNEPQNFINYKNKNLTTENGFCSPSIKEPEQEFFGDSCLSSNFLMDNDILKFGEKVPLIDLSCHVQVGEYIEVCPIKIYHPQNFYIQLRKLKKKLSHLTDDLLNFYSRNNEIYEMSDSAIKPEQQCVVFHKISPNCGCWLRAEIIKVLNKSKVIVNLIDYGIVTGVSKKNLRCLHRQFSFLPRQAILASLANVKPFNDSNNWPKNARQKFFDLINNKELIAGVVGFDSKIPWMSVALTLTKPDEIHVNDTLVNEGLADFVTTSKLQCNFYLSLNSFLNEKAHLNDLSDSSDKSSKEHVNNQKELPEKGYDPIFFNPCNKDLQKLFNLSPLKD